jgi:AcrR family transcriptional regulator
MSPSHQGKRPTGLRERKKAATRAAIQRHALRLFLDQGYAATTVEQIAEAAEVSPSTFFRYFPTKEETVLYDSLDPVFIGSFLRQPAELPPLAAMRASLRDVLASLPVEESQVESSRQQLIFSVPELRSAMLDQFMDGLNMINEAVAERTGREPDDFAVRTWSGAVIGVILAAVLTVFAEGRQGDFYDIVDAGLQNLEDGLPL